MPARRAGAAPTARRRGASPLLVALVLLAGGRHPTEAAVVVDYAAAANSCVLDWAGETWTGQQCLSLHCDIFQRPGPECGRAPKACRGRQECVSTSKGFYQQGENVAVNFQSQAGAAQLLVAVQGVSADSTCWAARYSDGRLWGTATRGTDARTEGTVTFDVSTTPFPPGQYQVTLHPPAGDDGELPAPSLSSHFTVMEQFGQRGPCAGACSATQICSMSPFADPTCQGCPTGATCGGDQGMEQCPECTGCASQDGRSFYDGQECSALELYFENPNADVADGQSYFCAPADVVYAVHDNVAFQECARLCQTDSFCDGFQYFWAANSCETLATLAPTALDGEHRNLHHTAIPCREQGSVDYWTKLDECLSRPCANGGLCVAGTRDYTCTCRTGFDGENCAEDINECDVDNGDCDILTNCTNTDGSRACSSCPAGYSGTGVSGCNDIDECDETTRGQGEPAPCEETTRCINTVGSFECGDCPAGFAGNGITGCDDIDECGVDNGDCDALVTCVNTEGSFSCPDCPAGFSPVDGAGCTEIDECLSEPCSQRGLCTDQVDSFFCNCTAGFTGPICDTNINECRSDPCTHGGTCNDDIGVYICDCTSGWGGTNCEDEQTPCTGTEDVCPPQSTCVHLGPGLHECHCHTGYDASMVTRVLEPAGCESSSDWIDSNGNDCSDYSADNCGEAWVPFLAVDGIDARMACCEQCVDTCITDQSVGECHAEINVTELAACAEMDECLSFPCQNGATCVDRLSEYICQCVAGFKLGDCQQDIAECSSVPCVNDGICTDLVDAYNCTCQDGFSGEHCETDAQECESSPCQNGGTCTDSAFSYTCACVIGYDGDNCETDINECDSVPCFHNAVCFEGVDTYTCTCTDGWQGDQCERDIDECTTQLRTYRDGVYGTVPIPNGGCDELTTCFNSEGSWSCGKCPVTNSTMERNVISGYTDLFSQREVPVLVSAELLGGGLGWSDAQAFCERSGRNLVPIRAEETNAMVAGLAPGTRLWIGLRSTPTDDSGFAWEWNDRNYSCTDDPNFRDADGLACNSYTSTRCDSGEEARAACCATCGEAPLYDAWGDDGAAEATEDQCTALDTTSESPTWTAVACNTQMSFVCGVHRKPWPTGGFNECVDIDECGVDNGGCSNLSLCTNAEGYYSCGPCPTIYQNQVPPAIQANVDQYIGSGSVGCVDVNECDQRSCDQRPGFFAGVDRVICTNTNGSFFCGLCPDESSYEQDDYAEPLGNRARFTPYTSNGTTGCVDVDECGIDNGGCDMLTTCTNYIGSFSCATQCPAGFDGTGSDGCVDINECDASPCDSLTECINTVRNFLQMDLHARLYIYTAALAIFFESCNLYSRAPRARITSRRCCGGRGDACNACAALPLPATPRSCRASSIAPACAHPVCPLLARSLDAASSSPRARAPR